MADAQSHRDHIVLDNLTRQEFDSYCSLVSGCVKPARRAQNALNPLFSGCIFVCHLTNPVLAAHPSSLGARMLARFGDELVWDDFIQELMPVRSTVMLCGGK